MAIYATNWYDAHIMVQKQLLLILMKSQVQMTVQSAGFGQLSHFDLKEVIIYYVYFQTIYN